jgi:hypothetical protein
MAAIETEQLIDHFTPAPEAAAQLSATVQRQTGRGADTRDGMSTGLDAVMPGSGAHHPSPERLAALLSHPTYALQANATRKAGWLTTLQQRYGNAYVQRVATLLPPTRGVTPKTAQGPAVQMQVTIGSPDDRYEREADTVSARVTAGQPAPRISRLPSGEVQSQGTGGTAAPPPMAAAAAQVIRTSGPGMPLPSRTRGTLEASLGADLSGVRVHTDGAARSAATALNARAFTHRHDIWLGAEASPDNLALMAHEATHVVQQGAADTAAETPVQRLPIHGPVVVQRDILDDVAGAVGGAFDAATGAVVDAAGNVIEATADQFWSVVERLAPGLVPLLREIADKGILGFMREKLGGALTRLFGGLRDNGGVLGGLVETFGALLAGMGEILGALMAGDCAPLFAALNPLKETVQQLAGDAWSAITDFFAPIGAFFTSFWASFGAPVLDWLQAVAGDVWEFIQNLGAEIWSWTQPIRDTPGQVWDWLKEQLGLGGEGGDSEGGLVQWVQDQASAAWGAMQEQLQPIIGPIQAVMQRVQEILPLDAILNLRQTVTGWLDNVTAMAESMNQPGGVVEQQTSLRENILPAVLLTMLSLRGGLVNAGMWVSDKIGSLVGTVMGFMAILSNIPLLSGFSEALQWLQDRGLQLSGWAQTGVVGLFTLVGDGLVFLSHFIEPVLNVLQKIVEVLGDLVGKLPDLILGPVWWILPDCIRNPIKEFILTQILSRIPIFGQFLAIPDVWARIQATAMRILSQIFLDGNLLGALWTYFSALLSLIGLPPELVTGILSKAASALSDILTNPVGFLINLLLAVKQGFVRFFGNIGTHLLNGVTGWLFGQAQSAGITPPTDLSFRSILDFVFEILGITMENIFQRLEKKIGKEKVDLLRKSIDVLTGAWEWISLLVNEGPGALWEQLKDKLSDLWSQVLTSVISWVSQTIIVQATVKLATFFDPSGIMLVVNSCIAIYKAIESFVQYVREMLEIVNSVLEGIGSIARGVIDQAASFLERSLVQSLPIAIGFLANQVGLGSLGSRIQEMVEAVRERVNQGIDWVIDKALQIGGAVWDRLAGTTGMIPEQRLDQALTDAQAAVNRYAGQRVSALVLKPLLEVIRLRYRLTSLDVVPYEDHWAVRGSASPSRQRPTRARVGSGPTAPTMTFPQPTVNIGVEYHFVERDQIGKVVEVGVMEWPGTTEKVWVIRYRLSGFKEGTIIIARAYDAQGKPTFKSVSSGSVPSTINQKTLPTRTRYSHITAGKASWVSAEPLAFGGGSPPGNANPVGWERIRGSARGIWIRGHLLNEGLGGPGGSGAEWNLVPIPQTMNSQMNHDYERLLGDDIKKGKFIRYKAEVIDYWSDLSSSIIGNASDFVKDIEVTFEEIKQQGSTWINVSPSSLSATSPKSYKNISLPKPGEIEVGRLAD